MSEELKMVGFRAEPPYLKALGRARAAFEKRNGKKIPSDAGFLRLAVARLAEEVGVKMPAARPPLGGQREGAGRKPAAEK